MVFSLVLPLVIYVFIGMPYTDHIVDETQNLRFIDVMLPALPGTVAANLLLMGVPIYLAELRSKNVVKRYRVLPLNTGVFAAALATAPVLVTQTRRWRKDRILPQKDRTHPTPALRWGRQPPGCPRTVPKLGVASVASWVRRLRRP